MISEITIDDSQVKKLLSDLSRRISDMSPVMRDISGIMMYAVEENFEQEGRPRWPDLAESTKEQRASKGKWPGKMLQVTAGGLASSCHEGSNSTSAWVDTNKVYAGPQQFGTKPFTIRPKNKPYLKFKIGDKWVVKKEIHHPGLKPRPFLKMTDEDMEKIRNVILKYMTAGTV